LVQIVATAFSPVYRSGYSDEMTTRPDSPDEPPQSSDDNSRLFVIGGVIILSVIGLVVCAGGVATPFIWLMLRRDAQRVEAEHQLQAQEALKKAEQERADREKKAVEPEEPDRTQSE
jgi:hypothetical protein